MTIAQAIQFALQHHQAGRLAEAESIYRQILALLPEHADALHLLGLVACQAGELDRGVDLIRRAVAVKPDWPEAYNNLGNALREMGRPLEAVAACRRASDLRPDYPDAWYNLGNALRDIGQAPEAIAAFRRAIELRPNFTDALNNLGNLLRDTGHPDEAIAAYRQAIALKPNSHEAYLNLDKALKDKGQLDEAIVACRQAIAIKPDYPEAHVDLGNALNQNGQLDEATSAFRQAIALRSSFHEAHSNLGNVLRDNGQLDQAIAAYRQSIAVKSDYPDAHSNLGVALQDKGQLDEALAAFHRAIALKPGSAEFHRNLALILLLRGDFPQGWAENEWRWRAKDFPCPRWNYTQPQWDGSDPAGQTVFLHAEQGFGDTLQLIRYAPLVAERGGRVILACPPELRRLVESFPSIARWIGPGKPLPPFDVHCPLLSLPLAFGTTLQTVPAGVPYLKADPNEAARWHDRLAGQTDLKVGLVWAGNPTHKNDRNRSLSLSRLAPFAKVQDVTFFSLQMGPAAEQAKAAPDKMKLIDWTPDLHDFADTAALVANLDLIISVDTAVVHLAGALGKPVWTLLPFMPDWRWLLDREDSPWYPTMRLFRQKAIGKWDEVIERVAERLSLLSVCPDPD